MGSRTAKTSKPMAGDPNDPEGMHAWSMRYLEAMRVRGFSEGTLYNRHYSLGVFIEWCEARSVTRPVEVTKPIVDRYQRHLYHYRQPKSGKPLTFTAQLGHLTTIRSFFKWLARQNVLLWNPASEIDLPRAEKRLPRFVLTVEEVERVMMLPEVHDPIGLRDRAILEVLYSTAIRRMELIHLDVFDLDRDRGTLMVQQGKGKKDRRVPIGERAVMWTAKYLSEVRPGLVVPPDSKALFLTQEGEPISPAWLSMRVRRYVMAADLGKTGGCHLFRHTCATLMLEGGADIRYIQELLGHEDLATTQIYTQVSIQRLKAVHALTHPGAKIEPLPKTENAVRRKSENERIPSFVAEPRREAGASSAPAGESERERRANSAPAMPPLARCDARDEDARAELLLSLAEEAEEEDEDLENQ